MVGHNLKSWAQFEIEYLSYCTTILGIFFMKWFKQEQEQTRISWIDPGFIFILFVHKAESIFKFFLICSRGD